MRPIHRFLGVHSDAGEDEVGDLVAGIGRQGYRK